MLLRIFGLFIGRINLSGEDKFATSNLFRVIFEQHKDAKLAMLWLVLFFLPKFPPQNFAHICFGQFSAKFYLLGHFVIGQVSAAMRNYLFSR